VGKLALTFMLLAMFALRAEAQNAPKETQPALSAAQAGPNRTGDESLGCESLESELVTIARDPAVQAYVSKAGTESQKKQKMVRSANSDMSARTAVSMFTALNATAGGEEKILKSQTQVPAQPLTSSRQDRKQPSNEPTAAKPQLLRAQRVLELAQARKCHWVQMPERSSGHEAGH
jgi:hypothetical protein